MNFPDVRKEFSSITEMAYRLGVTVATVYNWQQDGIPVKSQELVALKLEKMKMDGQQQQEMEQERYQRLMAAFSELIGAKVSTEALDTLRFESGLLPEDFDKLKEEL